MLVRLAEAMTLWRVECRHKWRPPAQIIFPSSSTNLLTAAPQKIHPVGCAETMQYVRRFTWPAGNRLVVRLRRISAMKIKNVRRAAFFNLRALIASLLCLTAGMLTLLAFVAIPPQPDNNIQATGASRWLTRLASTLGIESPAQRSASGGAIKLDKHPAERPQVTSQTAAVVPYSGPPRDLVRAVRSGKLRDMPPIAVQINRSRSASSRQMIRLRPIGFEIYNIR